MAAKVIPGLKYDPDELVAMFGLERGERIVEIAGGAADFAFDLIQRHGIRCAPTRKGWIQGVHTASQLDFIRRRLAQWELRGAPVRFLDRAEIAELTGTNAYCGGFLDGRGGMIQPALLCARTGASGHHSRGAGPWPLACPANDPPAICVAGRNPRGCGQCPPCAHLHQRLPPMTSIPG
jgi:glycine/D-amino acid oxidase-like deaminating enzyme